MNKSEILHDMALNRMGEDIAIITGDVSQLKLDVVTIQNELSELKQLVRDWKEKKRKNGGK